jgi:hypothetical protein
VDGRGKYYFVAVDSDTTKLRSTAIGAAELKDALKAIPGRVVVFLDTCHSGAFTGDDARNTGLTDDLVRDLTSDDCGVAVVCSSRGKQLSRSSSGQKAGLFTLAVEEALSGKATKDGTKAIYLQPLPCGAGSEKGKERSTPISAARKILTLVEQESGQGKQKPACRVRISGATGGSVEEPGAGGSRVGGRRWPRASLPSDPLAISWVVHPRYPRRPIPPPGGSGILPGTASQATNR